MPRRRRRKSAPQWLQWTAAQLVRGLVVLLGRMPPGLADRLGAGLGELSYWLLPGRRRIALDNIGRAFGDGLEAARRSRLVRASFRHLGLTTVECCRLFFGPPGRILDRVRVEGVEHVKAALAEGRGAFYLSAHFGNWELLGAAHVLAGYPTSVVVRPLDNPFLEALVAQGRRRAGLGLIPKRRALRQVQETLARGECVGILLDQDAGPAGAFVPFFGQPASTSRSLAVVALKTGAPVVPAFIRRLPGGQHLLTLEASVPVPATGDRHRDVTLLTARFAAVIERHVRAEPGQWFWVHRRWKSRPGR